MKEEIKQEIQQSVDWVKDEFGGHYEMFIDPLAIHQKFKEITEREERMVNLEIWFNSDGEFGQYVGWLIKIDGVSKPLDKEAIYKVKIAKIGE